MNWHRVPEFETVSTTADDNPFDGARAQPNGKFSVKLPVDEWLCRKMSSLNLTIREGYPTRNTDNTGLLRDQFIKTPRPSRWYGMHAEKDNESSTVCTWSPDPAKLNHSFSRVARRNMPTAPPSRAFKSRSAQALGESSTGTDSNVQPGCWFVKVLDQGSGLHEHSAKNPASG